MLAYPTESQKGRFIGIFWAIFNLGGVVGSAVSLGQNFDSEVCALSGTLLTVLVFTNRLNSYRQAPVSGSWQQVLLLEPRLTWQLIDVLVKNSTYVGSRSAVGY
jgi:hypothetical protein